MNDDWQRQSLDAFGRVSPEAMTAEGFWSYARAYFTWVKANPLVVEKAVSGRIVRYSAPRAMTITGLRAFTGAELTEPHLQRPVEMALDVMNEYNLTLGLVEVFNPMLIARTMGLPDKQEILTPGQADAPPASVSIGQPAKPGLPKP
ncbi:hypothetical protein RGQ15_09540 [Paracoccus sp. MBLB3053]|uniref:Uncharacterized protein n=1 Tax=Paracoccus aurantius TaxID=3073814 RepID=A0ABU2HU40_9RHOB|nr:hypothetical protein [Paracoccus sp. MBLB3053]MDS9467809.1 hypothetical protein [Paracoccus sp. MBLB3053]